jgi:BASS family bile acid:Na+ symporter
MFSFYSQLEYPLAATQLILAMAGMGATLTREQFRAILRRPQPIAIVIVLQYVLFPVLAAMIARWAHWPTGIAVGIVLMNAVPSGSFTNVFTYLGRGNVVLSIVMTCASTVVCFVATPLVLDWLTAAELPDDFHIPLDKTLYPVVLFLILPLAAGALVARYWSTGKDAFAKWAVRASLVPLAMIVVGSLASGRINVMEYGFVIPTALLLFIYATLFFSRRLVLLLGYTWSDAFTIGIEVAVRNGNLAIALAASLFPATDENDPVGRGVFFTVLFYSGGMMAIGLISVARRRLELVVEERRVVGQNDEKQVRNRS